MDKLIYNTCININKIDIFTPDKSYVEQYKKYGNLLDIKNLVSKYTNLLISNKSPKEYKHIIVRSEYICIVGLPIDNKKYILPYIILLYMESTIYLNYRTT